MNHLIFFYFFNIYLVYRERERETQCKWGRGRERETQNLNQGPGSELSAQSPVRLELKNPEIVTRAEVRDRKSVV